MPSKAEQIRLNRVRKKLAEKALELIDTLDEASIADAALHQRASAMGAVIDRLIKLTDMDAKSDGAGERVVRIEYRDPDGSIHQSPRWARGDHADADALQGRGVWAAIWQDGAGEASAD